MRLEVSFFESLIPHGATFCLYLIEYKASLPGFHDFWFAPEAAGYLILSSLFGFSFQCRLGFILFFRVRQNIYLRIRRGSGLKAGGTTIIGAGPPTREPDRMKAPFSLKICIAISCGAGMKGPRGQYSCKMEVQQALHKHHTLHHRGFSTAFWDEELLGLSLSIILSLLS
ncbi:hypothetical protein Lal_00031635 [Lupinus albus]|nr:hypothetical protein Lal_00031635 [Lupinus albus]